MNHPIHDFSWALAQLKNGELVSTPPNEAHGVWLQLMEHGIYWMSRHGFIRYFDALQKDLLRDDWAIFDPDNMLGHTPRKQEKQV